MLSRDPARFLARLPHLAGRPEFDWLCGHPANFSYPQTEHHYLLHLATATSAHLNCTDPVEMLQTKLASIAHVLDYTRHAGIRRMLVTSSGAVYGPQPATLSHIPESYRGAPNPLDAASAYGNGKRLVEQMCALAADVDTVIARCFCFIGPQLPLDARFAAGNFLRDALAGGPVAVRGDGRAVRSYLHAADLTIWLLTMLLRGKRGQAYNVGSDATVTTLELARLVARSAPMPVQVTVTGDRPGNKEVDAYVPDIACARSELGLEVSIPLASAVRQTMAWVDTAIKSPA